MAARGCNTPAVKRRHVLALSTVPALALALGWGVAQWEPGLRGQTLSASARAIFMAVAAAVLAGARPPGAASWADHIERLETLLAGLPPATRKEVSDLLGILSTAAGRRLLAGLSAPWHQASVEEVSKALQSMRSAALQPQQQAYQALRELTLAAHFSANESWVAMGYPGPKPL